MKHSYSIPTTPVSGYAPAHLPEAYADHAPWLLSLRGLDYHGDIRSAGSAPAGFVNFQSRPESGLCVALADVCSRTPAQPLVNRAESLLSALSAYEPLHPASVVEAVNRAVCGLAGDDSYLTLFHAWMDPARRELRYVSAGHEPAILFRKRRKRVTILEQTGTVLGLTPRTAYGERTVPLDAGDVLVVFTSAIAETANLHGSAFGSKGVLDVIRRMPEAPAAAIAQQVLDEAERHAGWAVRAADHGIAVMRYLGERERPAFLEAQAAERDGELALAAA